MIKISLTETFCEDLEIDKIYESLAQKIIAALNGGTIDFKYKETKMVLDTQESIKSFLLAKDFYNYSFASKDQIFSDLLNLDGKIKIEKLLDGTTTSSDGKKFYEKYNTEKYTDILNELRQHYGFKTITALKTEQINEEKLLGLEKEKIMRKLFDYTQLSADYRHRILTIMNVPVCPYCNVNYTLSYEDKGKSKTTADLDHFYIKSQYAEYALCLYNFVPSCTVCNSRLKVNKNMSRETHIFPHENSFERNARFEVNNITEVILNKSEQIQINLANYNNDEKINNSAEIFKINERYDYHKNFAKELLEKVLIYNDSYRDELLEKTDIFNGKSNIKSLIFGPNLTEAEYAKQSLGKLKMDLLVQFGIYKD